MFLLFNLTDITFVGRISRIIESLVIKHNPIE